MTLYQPDGMNSKQDFQPTISHIGRTTMKSLHPTLYTCRSFRSCVCRYEMLCKIGIIQVPPGDIRAQETYQRVSQVARMRPVSGIHSLDSLGYIQIRIPSPTKYLDYEVRWVLMCPI